MKRLIDAGADLEAVSTSMFYTGQTPLHRAVYADNVEAIKALLDAGANVNAKDRDGKTPADLTYRDEVKTLLVTH